MVEPVTPVCPLCLGSLDEGLECPRCGRRYPTTLGFADFRLGGRTEVDIEDDLAVAEQLAAREDSCSFAELEAYRERLRPEASAALRARHLAHFEIEREQADRAFELLGVTPQASALDLGCGMGRYVAAAAQRGMRAAGLDASICQLVLARKLLSELGLSATLVAGEAERPPFAPESFVVVVAADLLEHVADADALIERIGELLVAGGKLFLATPNRFSLTAEPHVGVWGLGYLPRAWAERMVERRLGVDYSMIRPLSHRRLRALLRRSFPGETTVLLPAPGPQELGSFSPTKRRLAGAFAFASRVPPARVLLRWITPYFQVLGGKKARASAVR